MYKVFMCCSLTQYEEILNVKYKMFVCFFLSQFFVYSAINNHIFRNVYCALCSYFFIKIRCCDCFFLAWYRCKQEQNIDNHYNYHQFYGVKVKSFSISISTFKYLHKLMNKYDEHFQYNQTNVFNYFAFFSKLWLYLIMRIYNETMVICLLIYY